MAHFAQIDSNNIVQQVIVVPDAHQHRGHDFCTKDLGLSGTWIQTSYNSRGGKHYTQVPLLSTKIEWPERDSLYNTIAGWSALTATAFLSSGDEQLNALTTVAQFSATIDNIIAGLSASMLSSAPVSSIYTHKIVLSAAGTHLRYNYAAIGHTYDPIRDAFIPPKPMPSWIIDEATCNWKPPVPMPLTPKGQKWRWDEATTSWIGLVTFTTNTTSYSGTSGIN